MVSDPFRRFLGTASENARNLTPAIFSRSFGKRKNSDVSNRLRYEIGGYTKESVCFAASTGLRGYDGAIQIFPAGCMPEIVGRAVLSRVSEETGLLVMSLICDEMSAEAGYLTRIEAFVDMLQHKKNKVAKGGTREGKASGGH